MYSFGQPASSVLCQYLRRDGRPKGNVLACYWPAQCDIAIDLCVHMRVCCVYKFLYESGLKDESMHICIYGRCCRTVCTNTARL